MNEKYNYTPLPKPIPISEQQWPEGTLPIVATSTLTFNHVNFIHECIDGILMQETTFPVRIVIFNDCSNDGTTEIVKEYEKKYPDLFFVTHAPVNTWGKPERQEALKPYLEARGIAKNIAMCEGDDYWTDPLKLQKQVDFLEANEDFSMRFHKVKITPSSHPEYWFPDKQTEFTIKDVINTKTWFIPTASVVFRNNFRMPAKPVNVIGGDRFLCILLADRGKLKLLDTNMSVYRIHEGGLTSNKKMGDKWLKGSMIMNKYLNSYFNFKYNKYFKKELFSTYGKTALYHSHNGSFITFYYLSISLFKISDFNELKSYLNYYCINSFKNFLNYYFKRH